METDFKDYLLDKHNDVFLSLDRKIWSFNQLLKFIRRRAQISTDYSKSIEKLLQKSETTLWFEEGTVRDMYEQLRKAEEEVINVHSHIGKMTTDIIVIEMEKVVASMEQTKKKIVSQGTQAVKHYHDAKSALVKAKDHFHKTSREIELIEYQLTELGSNSKKKAEHEKTEKKLAKLKSDLQIEKEAYQNQVTQTNTIQTEFFNIIMPNVMKSVQEMLRQRCNEIKESFHKFITYFMNEATDILEPYQRLGDAISDISVDSDLDEYVLMMSTEPVKIPPSYVFESYVNRGKSTEHEKKGGVFSRVLRTEKKKEDKTATYSPYAKAPTQEEALLSVFGTHLSVLMERQKETHPDLPIPFFLMYAAGNIIHLEGLSSLGVFRLNGSTSKVETLRQSINHGNYPLLTDVETLSDITSLFKLFFRQLPTPLMIDSLYPKCFIERDPNINEIIELLPEINRNVLRFTIRLLQNFVVPQVVEVTKMTIENLAAVFAPCFFRSPFEDVVSILKAAESEKHFMVLLIKNLDASHYDKLLEESESMISNSNSDGTRREASSVLPENANQDESFSDPTSEPISSPASNAPNVHTQASYHIPTSSNSNASILSNCSNASTRASYHSPTSSTSESISCRDFSSSGPISEPVFVSTNESDTKESDKGKRPQKKHKLKNERTNE